MKTSSVIRSLQAHLRRKAERQLRSTGLVGRLERRVIEAARKTAYMINKAHDGDESNIPDENVLVEAVEALDKAEGKTPNDPS